MTLRRFIYGVLFPLVVLGLGTCQYAEDIRRPRDPWAIRSVLDQRPRVLTLAMHPEVYLAYELSKGSLYKAWKGDIALNGAAFNDLKTIQPTSVGLSYLEDSTQGSTWEWFHLGVKEVPTFTYLGYHIHNKRIQLSYLLRLSNGDSLYVTEYPEVLLKPQGSIILERSFAVPNLPKGDTLYLYDANTVIKLAAQKNPIQKELILSPNGASPKKRPIHKLSHRGRYWLEKSGCNTCHEEAVKTIGPGYREIAVQYHSQKEIFPELVKKVKEGGSGVWGKVAMPPHPHIGEENIREMIRYILSLEEGTSVRAPSRGKMMEAMQEEIFPGWEAPLKGVHPSFDLIEVRPENFQPRVGAMDFLPNGDLLLSTWDSLGALYRLSGLEANDRNEVKITRIASGLAEPLGMKVVEGEIYVLQKQELSHLIDRNGDGLIDTYNALCANFGVTADFHEFSYGLEFLDGYFYANLGLAMRLMGHERQHPDRGRTIKISQDGRYEWVNQGLRQPNGIGQNLKGELFITENQGRWVPACKFIHVQEGSFEGCRLSLKDSLPNLPMRLPAVWLPQDEIGNSPGNPLPMLHGPYKGQMIHGEVTHGGIKRVFLEQVNGAYQGCVFRFSQGLEAGINRMVWSPDSCLYVGGIGMNGNWGWQGKQYGLQKLRFNGMIPFEMLSVSAKPKGIAIEFTQELDSAGVNLLKKKLLIEQWRYEATERYGGDKLDQERLAFGELSLSEEGKTLFIPLSQMKSNRVMYILLPVDLKSKNGSTLWSGEAWYTMNKMRKSL